MGENGKTFGEKKVAKLFARLPGSYSEMSEEDKREWREQLAKAVLEHHTKLPTRHQEQKTVPNESGRDEPADC